MNAPDHPDGGPGRAYVHRGGDRPLLGLTIDELLARAVGTEPSREAVVSVAQTVRVTYAELDRQVERVARGLVGLGVQVGDRVGIWSTDNLEWVLVQLACARAGAVLVNVNPAYRAEELEHALHLARVQELVLIPSFRSSDYVATLREVVPELGVFGTGRLRSKRLPELRHAVLFDPADAEATGSPAPGLTTWSELLARGDGVPEDELLLRAEGIDPDDPANVQFTSGTTGRAKAVVLTHHNIVNNGYFVGAAMRLGPQDRLCVPVPLYHCFGTVVGNLAAISAGATIVLPAPHFDASVTLDAIERERCTAVHGVPTMFIAELEEQAHRPRDLSTLRTGIMAGAPCPPDVVERVMEELGCREILIGYGQTEASPVTHSTHADDPLERRVGTVGTNLPHQEVKVVDPRSGRTVRIGEQGEACFRGYHVMREYFDQPEATREAIDGAGWLHSGDLAVMDADGYLQMTGRLKDMIIRGGENIYPAEIEAAYHHHPDVLDVAVFGVPDERMGEEVGAWFVLRAGAKATEEELRAYAREHLAHYKVPLHVWLVDELPLTVTGKVQKFRIREVAARWLAEGRA